MPYGCLLGLSHLKSSHKPHQISILGALKCRERLNSAHGWLVGNYSCITFMTYIHIGLAAPKILI